MWFTPTGPIDWTPALKHLSQAHPQFARVIKRVGPCTLQPRRDYFVVLCKAIFNQQLSMKAAATLYGRFCANFPGKKPTPQRLIDLAAADPEVFRRGGVSRQKNLYLIDLAKHFADGEIPTRRLGTMSDEEVIESLTRVHGIGRWTAEMFLMFTLNRPDVWPVDDLGLRKGAQKLFGLKRPPELKKLMQLGEPLRPWRTVATWYIWRGMDFLDAEKKS